MRATPNRHRAATLGGRALGVDDIKYNFPLFATAIAHQDKVAKPNPDGDASLTSTAAAPYHHATRAGA